MAMQTDFTFIAEPVSDEQIDDMYEAGMDLNVSGHDGLTFVLATVAGVDPVSEALALAARLAITCGVRIQRADLDLVNQAMIADLCEVSREAVSQWAAKSTFPLPHTVVRTPLWAWCDVTAWLRQVGRATDDAMPASSQQVEDFNQRWRHTLATSTAETNLTLQPVAA